MHVPDSSGIVGGLYVATPTRTIIGRHALNAFAQEILGVLADAGISPRASGTADAAASYTGQLRDAVRVLANKQFGTALTVIAADTAAASSITPPTNSTSLHLGGSYAGNVTLAENDGNYTDRIIIITNTGTGLLSIGSSGHRVRLEPGNLLLFKYDATRSTNNKWVPIFFPKDTDSVPEGSTNLYWTTARFDSAFSVAFGDIFSDAFATDFISMFPSYFAAAFDTEMADKTFDGCWADGTNTAKSSTLPIKFKEANGFVTLWLPAASFTTGSGGGGGQNVRFVRIISSAVQDLPSEIVLNGLSDSNGVNIRAKVNGTWVTLRLGKSVDAGKMVLYTEDGSTELGDTVAIVIPGQAITYAAIP